MTKLILEKTDKEGLHQGTKKNGIIYSVRDDRSRFFYPSEWNRFYASLRDKNKPHFDFLVNTGVRINESLFIRPMDFDFNRKNIRVWKTKVKAKLGERIGKPRTISLSSAYAKRAKKLCNGRSSEEYLYKTSKQAAWGVLRRNLKKVGIKDWYNFGLHNIRKTHGMWLKSMGIEATEICLRLGHSYETYLRHYGSADVFTETDIRWIEKLMDDLYSRKRRY